MVTEHMEGKLIWPKRRGREEEGRRGWGGRAVKGNKSVETRLVSEAARYGGMITATPVEGQRHHLCLPGPRLTPLGYLSIGLPVMLLRC